MTRPMVRLKALVLPLLAVVLLASGTWLAWDAAGRRTAHQAGQEAARAAGDSIVAILSYQPASAAQTLEAAARDRLTGAFQDTYTQLVKTVVVPESLGKGIASTAKVPATGVVSADSGRAVVLAYVDQVVTVGKEPPTQTNSSVRVTMNKVDGRWLISGFDPI